MRGAAPIGDLARHFLPCRIVGGLKRKRCVGRPAGDDVARGQGSGRRGPPPPCRRSPSFRSDEATARLPSRGDCDPVRRCGIVGAPPALLDGRQGRRPSFGRKSPRVSVADVQSCYCRFFFFYSRSRTSSCQFPRLKPL